MATGWLKGVVKEVPSGDTLVISGVSKGGIPPEKRITLSSIDAPRMGRRDGDQPDQTWAWESREFLRKLAIGQECTFKVDYVLENLPGREFGSVFIGNNENVALTMVSRGWAKVRTSGENQKAKQSPWYDQLKQAEEAAQSANLGTLNKDAQAVVRKNTTAGYSAEDFVQEKGTGMPLPAIVEAVLNGSTLRVTLLPELQSALVALTGVQAPSLGRRPAPDSEESETEPAPFAREAKYFAETKVLNREVRVVLNGVETESNNPRALGTVFYSQGDEAVDLGSELVKLGYARVADRGAQLLPQAAAFKLREADRTARQQKVGMWKNYVPTSSATVKLSDQFKGIVSEVVSGDCVVVRDAASQQERRVMLSSIKAPRVGNRSTPPEDWALEAKEFLRSRLIGQEVSVSLEYTRKVGGENAAGNANGVPPLPERVMSFGTVTISEKDRAPGAPANRVRESNVAELLLVRGLAEVVKHHQDDERSAHYPALLDAAAAGNKNKKGKYGSKEPPKHHTNDVSLPGNAAKARQYLPFLQREPRVAAVVEYVLSGHRLKLVVPKEGATIAFSPSGVRTPQRAMPARAGMAATQDEPYWEEAYNFTRLHCMQRSVEVSIDSVDRGGTFLGTLWVGQLNLGVELLRAGLARLHPAFDPDRVAGGAELAAAQAQAQAARLKVWESYAPPKEGAEGAEEANGSAANGHSKPRETMQVTVTEVRDASSFFVQAAEDAGVKGLTEQLGQLGLELGPEAPPAAPSLQPGTLVLAQFSADKQWYRAAIERAANSDPVNPTYTVYFVDWGNREDVPLKALRSMEPQLGALAPQATPATLAYLKIPGADDEIGYEAGRLLSELAGNGKPLRASVERREAAAPARGKARDWEASRGRLHLLLSEPDAAGPADSINAKLLAAGVARLNAPRYAPKDVVEALAEAEDKAKKGHLGVWEYGDPGDEEDEDDRPAPKGAWGRPR